MQISPGTILISAPSLDDPHFIQSVILISEYNQQGAIGFVINAPFERKLNELVEFQQSRPFDLYVGGPVEQDKLFVLHRRPLAIGESDLIADGVYMGGDFKQVLVYINQKINADSDVRLLLGYCGWEAGQLEAEINEGSWLMVNAVPSLIFGTAPEVIWENLYSQPHR